MKPLPSPNREQDELNVSLATITPVSIIKAQIESLQNTARRIEDCFNKDCTPHYPRLRVLNIVTLFIAGCATYLASHFR